MNIKKIRIRDLYLHYADIQDFTDHMYELLKCGEKQSIIVHVNLRNYYFMNKDKELYDDIKKNSIPVFEGIGLKSCMALKGFGNLNDLNGTDLFPLFMKKLAGTDHKIYLLGGSKEALKGTIEHIEKKYTDIKIAGCHNGYFKIEDEERIVKDIDNSRADILMISMGFPLQEKFVFKNRNKFNVSLIWNLGGLFDIISGLKPRAPLFVRNLRLEWLHRFLKEPYRMLHRNTTAAAWSIGNILFQKKQ
ncbi:MAG TPA: WecB/TagA/CpsF family glycosyltransferase [Ignavibacteria bacterium]|nr:WecB/TagA/CpsF family glycosyltransferase [Ignavibacteria bacterium]